MELTTRIFTDLAEIAKWAFNATLAKPGTYTLTEILRDKEGDMERYDNRNGKMLDFLAALNPDALEDNEEETQTAESATTSANDESTTPAAVNPNSQTETIHEDEKAEKGEPLELCRTRMLAYYMTNSILRLNGRAREPQRLAIVTTAASQSIRARGSITSAPCAIFSPLGARNTISRVFVPIARKNLIRAKYHGKLSHNTHNPPYYHARGPTQKAA